jgi:IS1 family transposase
MLIAKVTCSLQMDELWSFVDNKKNKQWVWLAIDSDTREILAAILEIGLSERNSQ